MRVLHLLHQFTSDATGDEEEDFEEEEIGGRGSEVSYSPYVKGG